MGSNGTGGSALSCIFILSWFPPLFSCIQGSRAQDTGFFCLNSLAAAMSVLEQHLRGNAGPPGPAARSPFSCSREDRGLALMLPAPPS